MWVLVYEGIHMAQSQQNVMRYIVATCCICGVRVERYLLKDENWWCPDCADKYFKDGDEYCEFIMGPEVAKYLIPKNDDTHP